MLKLPSTTEIESALDAIAGSPPVPLAQFVDKNQSLTSMLDSINASLLGGSRTGFTALKAAFVLGLHVGIVLGESRSGVR